MARVVQRSSNPPYLVIIFILLFLVSTALAVMWNIEKGELAKKNLDAKAQSDSLATTRELATPRIQAMLKAYRGSAKGAPKQTILAQLIQNEAKYSSIIAGRPDMSLPAIEAEVGSARAMLGNTDTQYGLLDELRRLKEQLDLEVQKVKDRDNALLEKEAAVRLTSQAMDKLAADKDAVVTTLQGDVKKTEDQLKLEQGDHQGQRDRDRAEHNTRVDGLNNQIAKANDDIQTLQLNIQKKETTIADLRRQIEELTNRDSEGSNMPRKSAGMIMSEPKGNVCYVNIGAKEGVQPGITFAIYPSGVITKDMKTKGSLMVTKVHELISECKITKVNDNVTIDKRDTIANIAFDTRRTYVFVVAGQFDLHGAGKATLEGTEEVNILIRSYGGKIAGDVDIHTDFVILGEQMSRPTAPDTNATTISIAVYNQQMKIYNRYEEIRRKASDLGIKPLNTNQFLDYIGMVPKKTLRYE